MGRLLSFYLPPQKKEALLKGDFDIEDRHTNCNNVLRIGIEADFHSTV